MTLVIKPERITATATPHTAIQLGADRTCWNVTWLPGVRLDRDQAIAAMTLADEQETLDRDTTQALASELGLTTLDVQMRLTQSA